MGFFNELRGAVKAIDPIGAKVFDRALKNDALSVKAGSHGIQWLGNALGWDGLESFGHHWAQMADADVKDPNRQLKNAALTAAAIYAGMSAGGEAAAGAETGSSVALGEAGGYGAAASAETAGTATALGEAGGYGATTAGAAATTSSGSTTAAAKSGVGKYATVNNAQKLYSGLQLAQALTAPKVPGAAPPPKASQTPGLQNARGNLSGGTPGVASTFLTGTAGVDPSLLNLGRSTLLGG